MADTVPAHIIRRTLTEVVIDPQHARRRNTPAFRAAKRRLKQDGHWRCYICGATTRLEAHHRGMEYMFEADTDFAALKAFCEEWDLYGYGRLLQHQPITTVDDVRNLMVLCATHHREAETGIHMISFPAWIAQKLAKPGADPVPQEDAHA
ncbi:MAG: hypothetical protein K6V97_03735 [Actinomycetia bacterium]|nr:hypothetical protein [Actinomycetes bacterium]